MKQHEDTPQEDSREENLEATSEKETYETPKVESVQLSPEAAEALT